MLCINWTKSLYFENVKEKNVLCYYFYVTYDIKNQWIFDIYKMLLLINDRQLEHFYNKCLSIININSIIYEVNI